MANTVFFSWQSDLPETRNVIRWALEKAVGSLNRVANLEEALRVDEDTAEVAGWPDIASTIMAKINECSVFVADLTPISGPRSGFRLCPNPNVMFELGYAMATGAGRTRIVCIVNKAYLPEGEIASLPFDVRGSRPLVFLLADPGGRDVAKGEEDPVRTEARQTLAASVESALRQALDSVEKERASRLLAVSPHLAKDGEKFQLVLRLETGVPFQFTYQVQEPSGNILSGIMMSPASVDPKGLRELRAAGETLKPLSAQNDLYILTGAVAHVATSRTPVPSFHAFKVIYRLVGEQLVEVSREQPPPH